MVEDVIRIKKNIRITFISIYKKTYVTDEGKVLEYENEDRYTVFENGHLFCTPFTSRSEWGDISYSLSEADMQEVKDIVTRQSYDSGDEQPYNNYILTYEVTNSKGVVTSKYKGGINNPDLIRLMEILENAKNLGNSDY